VIGTLYGVGQQIPGLLWSRPTRRPKYTREQISATALAIADAEGIEAVTMRRIATDLGAGTMTIYHYVASKADLIALMLDAIMAEQFAAPEDLPADDWRTALTAIAHRTRAMLRRHPWALTGFAGASGSGAAGPQTLRHFEQSLAAVASTGLPPEDRMDLIAAVDDYVAGFVLKSDREPGLESVPESMAKEANEYLDQLLDGGEYPHVAQLLGEGDRFAALLRVGRAYDADQRFERGLRRLLDGVAAEIARTV
jgi:AcrR family transcriptional regulator